MIPALVKKFNALPRKEKAPSGLVPNEWHFDLRYIQIEPPSHVVTIVQPQSQFIHMQRLPLGLPASSSGIAFFPESGKQAAPEVAKALLFMFVNNLGQKEMMGDKAPPAFAPWKLTTEDKDLAAAVGDELKRLGVRAAELHKIAVSKKSVNKIMDDAFSKVFARTKMTLGLPGIAVNVIATPEPIAFYNLRLTPRADVSGKAEGTFELALKYTQQLANARPLMTSDDIDSKTIGTKHWKDAQALVTRIEAKPENAVKADADAGDVDAAFDYGLRLLVGLGCEANRTLSRNYLIQVILSPGATDELKATAHGILINWYISPDNFRSRYMFAASHHANIAAALCRRVSPPGTHASPAVLWFMARVFEPQSHKVLELNYWFKDAIKALEFRNAQIATEDAKMERKRLKNPNRYACAAVGCGIEADAGRMLSRCAGKCDADKKPSYCSKECQLADWKNHKPFCKPGAACSVIDTGNSRVAGGSSSKQGAIQIPITRPDGSTHVVSSSTFDAQFLKEFREHVQNGDVGGGAMLSSTTVEFGKIEM